MAGEWPTLSLREAHVTLIDCDHRTPPASNAGYPYVAIPQLRNGRIDLSEARRISHEHFVDWTRKAMPAANDVVLSRRCNPGETAFVPPDLEFALGQNLVLLRADGMKVYPPFLRWLVQGPEWWEQIGKFLNVGAIFDSLRCADVPNFELCIPPMPEQRAIAHILGTLDAKIELNLRMNETLEAMARALFKSWFVDFDPVRARVEGRDPGLPKPLVRLFPDSFEDSELGEIPKGWQVKALNDVLSELETGGRPKGGVSGYATGTPSVGAESIVGLGVFDYSKTKYVPDEFFGKMTKGRIKSRDVLLYKDGGRPGEFEPHVTLFGDGFPFDTCAINEHVYRMRVKQEIGQNFLLFWLSSDVVMEEMRIKGTGVAIPGLNSTHVKSLAMLVPMIQVAKAFDALVDLWITRILVNCNESRTLSALRDTLLPKLLSGELNVTAKITP